MTALAAATAAMAAVLLIRAGPRLTGGRAGGRPWLTPVTAGAVAVLVLVRAPGAGLLAVLAALTVTGGALLGARRTRRREAAASSLRVLECCELVAAELSAGLPPGRALRRAAGAWPALLPVAEAFDLGGDVPSALRSLARRPGMGDLRLVAAAWVVAHRTGEGLADAVQRCADAIRQGQATRRVVSGELASARSTARLVAALPVLALAMGSGTGGDPVGFLVGHPLGLACLAGGLLFGFVGLWWIEAIADDVDAAT